MVNRVKFSVVDLSVLKVRLLEATSVVRNQSYRRQAMDMPSIYKMGISSVPVMGTISQDVGFYANSSVAVTLQMYDKDKDEFISISKGVAETAGRFVVKSILPRQGVVDLRLKIYVAPSSYTVGVTGYEAWGPGDWGHLM